MAIFLNFCEKTIERTHYCLYYISMRLISNLFTKSSTQGSLEQMLISHYGQSGATRATAAMRQATVWACVNLLGYSQGILPIKLMQKNKDGTRTRVLHHNVSALLEAPNDYQTPFDLAYDVGAQLAMYGNFHANITWGVGRKPLEIIPFLPKSLKAERTRTGKIVYKGSGKEHKRKDILHFRGLSFDGLNGVSPIEYNRGTIGVAVKAGEHAYAALEGGGRPAGIITLAKSLSDEMFKKMKESWNSGSLRGKTHFLRTGDEYSPISMNNADMQYIETSQLKLTEICSIFGVPPHMVADVTQSANSNLAAQNIQFIKHTMLPKCTMIEQRYTLSLLTPEERTNGLYIKHNMTALERADLLTRAQAAVSYRTAAVATPNELRSHEDLPPVKGGDNLFAPLNSSATANSAEEGGKEDA